MNRMIVSNDVRSINAAAMRAERALFDAMAQTFAVVGYRELQLAIERQNKRLAELHRAELQGEGWVL